MVNCIFISHYNMQFLCQLFSIGVYRIFNHIKGWVIRPNPLKMMKKKKEQKEVIIVSDCALLSVV
jgi:hypothetical protein